MPLNLKPSNPPLHTRINAVIRACRRIKRLLRHHRIFLDLEAKSKDRRESICELQDAHRADKTRDVGELRDSCADDPGKDPVEGHEANPEELACLGGEGRSAEKLLEDFDVGDFDADVAVERGGDEARHHVHDVAGCLPVVG